MVKEDLKNTKLHHILLNGKSLPAQILSLLHQKFNFLRSFGKSFKVMVAKREER